MNYKIVAPSPLSENVIVQLPASKSLSNRALILDALSGFKSKIINLSKANDTKVLQRILNHKERLVDVEDAGTALRFAAVYFSLMDGEHVITGTERLMNRPMQPLLDALKRLGGKAIYKTLNGKTVLTIHGGKLKGGEVSVDASLSSQFISALLLCGAAMKNGLVVNVDGKTVSQPYIDMTLSLMSQVGINYQQTKKSIAIPQQVIEPFKLKIENDWSSASYFYALLASYDRGEMLLKDLAMESLQGDAIVMDLMEVFGVKSIAMKEGIMIQKKKLKLPKSIVVDANDFPDLVPALAVAALCNDVEIKFKNVSHLRLKESDRVEALVTIAKQFGADAKVNGRNSFTISRAKKILSPSIVPTFNDHRLAMAFSIMSTRCENVVVENALVVKKSFPDYWRELKKIGFTITRI